MPVGAVWLHACWASAAIAFVARNARRLQKTKSPLRQRAFVELRQIKKFWSGRRDSNPRPRPWQGRALPLSYTRIREFGGDIAPATGRAMPNAARECNSGRTAKRLANLPKTEIFRQNRLIRAEACSPDARPLGSVRAASPWPGSGDFIENLRFPPVSRVFCRLAAVAFTGRIWHSSARCRRFCAANLSDAGVAQW